MGLVKTMGIAVLVLGILGFIIGATFFGIGIQKNQLIVNRMNVEKVTLALDPDHPDISTQINSAAEAQQAADTIASHRRRIAPTYQDLLGGKQFDATNTTQLTYVQAMNLENYLYTAVTAFGLIQVAEGAGGFMMLTGAALFITGVALYRFGKVYQIEH